MWRDVPAVMAFSLAEKLESMSWLELILWIGLAMLSISLVVLMGTRWGQVRPVSKCVVLSVFAHILFFFYAYGTSFHFAQGSWNGSPLVKVSFIAAEDAGDSAVNGANTPAAVEPTTQAAEPVAEPAQPSPAPSTPTPNSATELVASPPSPTAPPPATTPKLVESRPNPSPAAEPPPLLPTPSAPATPAVKESAAPKLVTEPVPADNSPTEAAAPVAAKANAAPPPDLIPDPTAPKPKDVSSSAPAVGNESPSDNAATSAEPQATANAAGSAAQEVIAAESSPTPLRPVDQQPLPEPYRLRGAPNRLRLAMPYGASAESESAVTAALDWLAAHQDADGRWDASRYGAGRESKTLGHDRRGAGDTADTGITGLALLAFLGGGHTHIEGLYRETVQRGLQFLVREQQTDGSLAGDAKLFEKMYCHGIATLAVGEAYAMTGDARLEAALRRAVQYTLNAQDRVTGGWRYQPGDRGDMSQFGWQVMALRSAQLGEFDIPAETRTGMIKFMGSVTQGRNGGLASYRSKEKVSRTMTAEALACRFFLDEPMQPAAVEEAQQFILQELPGESEPNLYFWYYGTLALFQAQGDDWSTWNDALQRQLLATQRHEEGLAGSWDTRDVWGGYGGRIYTTSMATLCLEVYYRYLPIFDPEHSLRRAKAGTPGAVRR